MNNCFVSLTLSAPVLSPREGICYLAIPIGYRMWTKERTKPELAGDFIVKMMSLMKSLPLYSNRLWSNLTAGRLNQAGPYAQGHWPYVFLQSVAAFIPIAWMRYRRGRPESLCPIRSRRRLPGQMATAGGPLRTEGFPKRRYRFEFVAAKPHLRPSERQPPFHRSSSNSHCKGLFSMYSIMRNKSASLRTTCS